MISYNGSEDQPLKSKLKTEDKANSERFLWFSVCVGCLLCLSTGSAAVWTSPTLPKLKSSDTSQNPLPEPITLYEEALVASLHSMGMSIGGLLLGRFADKIGRKWTLILVSTLEFSSFLILALAKNINSYYFARLVQGLCLGSTATVMPLFISEITEDHNRGKFGTFSTLFMCLGNIYGFIMGSFFEIKWFTLFCAAPLLISIPLFVIFIPESPFYLVSKGNKREAQKAFEKFRLIGPNEAEKVLLRAENVIAGTSCSNRSFVSFLGDYGIRRALFMSIVLYMLQQLTGLFAVLAYLNTIFTLASIPLSENLSSILVSVVQLFANMVTATFIDKLGRKLLLLISSAMVTISLLTLAIYFELLTMKNEFLPSISWLPIIALIIFVLGFGFGLGPVCFILSSEIFPQEFKSIAGALSLFSCGVSSFIVVYTFPVVRDLLGISWCFWILTICCFLGFIFINVFIPETKEVQPLNASARIKEKKSSERFLWFFVGIGCLLCLSTGAAAVWTSPTLPKLKSTDTSLNPLGKPITLHEEALIASLHPLGISIGGLILSRLADYIGRKWTLMTISSLELTSLLTLALARNIYLYYITRLVQGLCLGVTVTVMPLFISEITEDHNRGKFGTFSSFFVCLGNIYGFTVGSLLEIKWFTLICAAPLLISIPIFAIFIPESPFYLVLKGHKTAAQKALQRFRVMEPNDARKVLLCTENIIAETSRPKRGVISFLSDHGIRRGLFISIVLYIIQQFTGLLAILAYLNTTFTLANIPVSENISSILVAVMQLLANVVAGSFIEKLGRKFLLLTSSSMITISLLTLAVYFELLNMKYEFLDLISWLPILAIVIFILGYGFGLGPVCFILSSEIFPQDFKTKAGSISNFAGGIASFAVVYTFPVVRDIFGISWCFWILSVCCMLGFVFIFFFIPETKVCLFQLSAGAAAVWTSPVIPKLKDINSKENPLQRQITSYEEGLIASIITFGGLLGPIIFSRIADLLGRKWFLIANSVISIFSFVILAQANHIYMFYFGRILQGLCIGCSSVLPIYISEISDKHNRGKLVTINSVFMCLGNVYGYTLGSFFELKLFTVLCSVPLVISVPLFMFFIPESSLYLVMKGKKDQAKKALKKFRNLNDYEVDKALSETKVMIDEMPVSDSMLVLMKNRGFRRSLVISIGVFIFIEFTGIVAIMVYLHTTLSTADIPFSQNLTSIVLSLTQTFAVLLGTILMDKFGRKLLQLLSAFVVAISLFIIGIYFQLKDSNFDTENISWLPVLCVVFFIVAYGIGLGPVCYVLMTEIFPPGFRVKGSSLSMVITQVAAFIVVFFFPLVRDSFGIAWCFWILGISTLCHMVFTHFYVIETKNKTFLEIQNLLEQKVNYRRPNYS